LPELTGTADAVARGLLAPSQFYPPGSLTGRQRVAAIRLQVAFAIRLGVTRPADLIRTAKVFNRCCQPRLLPWVLQAIVTQQIAEYQREQREQAEAD
jgi:hypothetical protein